MDEEQIKELEKLLIDITNICEKLPERYRDSSFELLSKNFIIGSTKSVTLTGMDVSSDSDLGDFDEDPLTKLAKLCNISPIDLQNVISVDGDKLILVCSLSGSDSVKQVIGTMVILLCYNILFSAQWVSSLTILEILKKLGIEDKGGNFSTNLKKKNSLILKKPSSNEYMLTTSNGNKVAKHLVNKLSKFEPITKKDLSLD